MRLAVISDIHDRLKNMNAVLDRLEKVRPDVLVCCGDLTRVETLFELAAFPAPLHLCLGNCDLAHAHALLRFARTHNISAFASHGSLGLPGSGEAAFTHYPEQALDLAGSGRYRAVFYGHTHNAKLEHLELPGQRVLLANPGDVQGRHGDPRALIWDAESGETSWVLSHGY